MGEPAKQLEYPRFCTLDDYWKISDQSLEKLEFRGVKGFPRRGEIVAMPGGTEYHGLIIGNVGGALWYRLRGKPCRYYASDFRLGVHGYPTYTYSDGFVICGPTVIDDRDPTGKTALNPRLIVEVLSPTTEAYDRGTKFARYMDAESLQEYVIVSQHRPRVEVFFRQPGGSWLLTPYVGVESTAVLHSLGVDLPLSEIYLNVVFPPGEEGTDAHDPPATDRSNFDHLRSRGRPDRREVRFHPAPVDSDRLWCTKVSRIGDILSSAAGFDHFIRPAWETFRD